MNDSSFENNSGIVPYVAPEFYIDETKALLLDEHGELKQVVKLDLKDDGKRNYKWVLYLAIVLFAVWIIQNSLYAVFDFTPKKWEKEYWRPVIISKLMKMSKLDIAEKTVVDKFYNSKDYFSEMSMLDQQFTQYEKTNEPYDLLFKTHDQIVSVIGEPNPLDYEHPEFPPISEKESQMNTSYEAFYAYGDEGKAQWIMVKYFDKYAVLVWQQQG